MQYTHVNTCISTDVIYAYEYIIGQALYKLHTPHVAVASYNVQLYTRLEKKFQKGKT